MPSKIVSFLLILLVLCTACHKEKPPMPEKQMEDILYDMHKAESYLDYNSALYSNNQFKADFHHTILEQHRVTRAEFDTAIVWYVSHMDLYKGLYSRLVERFKAEKERLQKQLEENRHYISPEGDSVNIWRGSNTHFISSLTNKAHWLLRYSNDINYKHGDTFYLRFKPVLSAAQAPELPVLDFTITYSNDSVQTISQPLKSGVPNEIMIPSISYYSLNFVSGAIRMPNQTKEYNPMVITDIELWRVHAQKTKPEAEAPGQDSTRVQTEN